MHAIVSKPQSHGLDLSLLRCRKTEWLFTAEVKGHDFGPLVCFMFALPSTSPWGLHQPLVWVVPQRCGVIVTNWE